MDSLRRPTSWQCLSSVCLARFCGLPEPDVQTGWAEWVEGLSFDNSELALGICLQRLGRIPLDTPRHDPRKQLLSYISSLEHEFQEWLEAIPEVVDYYLASEKIGPTVPELEWNWLPKHQALWNFRGKYFNSVPTGIRVAPLVANSLRSFNDTYLKAVVTGFLVEAAASATSSEHWLEQIESACTYLDLNPKDVVGDGLTALKANRWRTSDAPVKGAICSADIASVEQLLRTANIVELSEALSRLNQAILKLENLGLADHWSSADSDFRCTEAANHVLSAWRARGAFQFRLLRGNQPPSGRLIANAFNRLRESLSTQEYSTFGAQIDLVQATVESYEAIDAYLTRIEPLIQADIDRAIALLPSEPVEGYQIIDSCDFDHWRHPK
jgi:hypothetical protein